MSRVLVVWCPDWPLVAGLADEGVSMELPAAVLAKGAVLACNAAARQEGVRRGMRRRDAQSRCPELILLDDNPDLVAREFEPVVRAVEEMRPGVALLRPGLLAVRAPGRFYGGEPHAAALLAERLVEVGVWDCRIGIADDLFTAEQAARRAAPQEHVVIESGGSAAFLCELPLEVLVGEVVGLLHRLGLRTLGDLAALPAADVHARFGEIGARVHRLVRGEDRSLLAARTPPPELAREVGFEPPLDSVETICMSVRRTADDFVAGLGSRNLVATAVRVEAECDGEVASARSWVHAGWFRSVDLVDRVHWQLRGQGWGQAVTAPVGLVRFVPEVVEPAAAHAETLLGDGTDERVARGVAKVQAMLGYDAVVVPVLQGGRAPAERQALVPWGERATGLRPRELPWPGSIPPPAPSRVLPDPWPAAVLGAPGRTVLVSDRGVVNLAPARFAPDLRDSADWQPVAAWAGPWPVEGAWWEAGVDAVRIARFQLVGVDGRAWLMRCEGDRWWTEASYE